MFNEIKLLVEKILTTEQYVLNMKYRTPEIIDYTLRKLLNRDIGKESNSLISLMDDKYIIITLVENDICAYMDKCIMYKGKYAYLCCVPRDIRNEDFSATRTTKIIYNIVTNILKNIIYTRFTIHPETLGMIITMDILTSLFREHNYIINYFKEVFPEDQYGKIVDNIYGYIINNDNATTKLLDEFEIARIDGLLTSNRVD